MDDKLIYLIIPAYNEEKMIKKVVKNLQDYKYKNIIIVDDGSRDKTYECMQELEKESNINDNKNNNGNFNVIALKHDKNKGVGGATITGLKKAYELGADVAITFDADGQHAPEDIEKVIIPIINGSKDYVVGSRIKDPKEFKNMPFTKKVGNLGLSFITFLLGGYFITDSQSGLRAFSNNALKVLSEQLKANRYETCSEALIIAKKNKLNIGEVPIQTIYTEYSMARGTNVMVGFKIFYRLLMLKFGKVLD
ncbi:glycosyltransferase family 2 protein [Methanococcus voltae]|uniref:Glycosyl transferase family 2 n=1 Tax=Methanococcus voltae (strain ATCC BAA-1334 / A3) TaxID=456320 RepID=D7DTE4_METV3|nr:glycosyltransferase family 2 protein [Methanococcus voltae]MCS3901256.1 glycosyltransferase involved in cell wall biosynthesis [Methanococcus voltae]